MTLDRSQRRQRRLRRRRFRQKLARWLGLAFDNPMPGRFQFTIRDLLVVTMWAAVLLGFVVWVARHNAGPAIARCVMVVVSATLIVAGIGLPLKHILYIRRCRRWPQSNARILGYWIVWDGGVREDCHPVLAIRTPDGAEVVAISTFRAPEAWRKSRPVGAEVNVHYHLQDPVHAEIDGLLATWRFALLLCILWTGAIAAAFAACFPD